MEFLQQETDRSLSHGRSCPICAHRSLLLSPYAPKSMQPLMVSVPPFPVPAKEQP